MDAHSFPSAKSVVVQGKDDENFAVRRSRLFRSHHDLESKKTERNTENLTQWEIQDTVAFIKVCNQANGQEASVNENFVNENFAVDVAKPWAGYANPNLIKG